MIIGLYVGEWGGWEVRSSRFKVCAALLFLNLNFFENTEPRTSNPELLNQKREPIFLTKHFANLNFLTILTIILNLNQ